MTILETFVKLRDDLKLWVTNNLKTKQNKNLGTENKGKFLSVDSEGNIFSTDITAAQIGADAKGSAAQALTDAKAYTDDEIEELQIGGRNLFLNTGKEISNNNYCIATYVPADEPLVAGERYTISMCVTPAIGVTEFVPHFSNGNEAVCLLYPSGNSKQILTSSFIMRYDNGKTPDDDIQNAKCAIYRRPNDGTVTENTTIHWFKIEKGNKATDWTPAPEDILAEAKKYTDTEKAKYLPLSGGTMTGDVVLSNPKRIVGTRPDGTTGLLIGVSTASNILLGANGVYNDLFTYHSLIPGTSVSGQKSLGDSKRFWKNLYLSGVLSDGTNSIAVANIANKNNYLPLAGGTMTGSITIPAESYFKMSSGAGIRANEAGTLVINSGSDSIVLRPIASTNVSGLQITTEQTLPEQSMVMSLGTHTNMFKNLYLSGALTDGTSSISVANIANKNNYLPLTGGTMTGELIVNGGDAPGGSKIVLATGKGHITDSSTSTLLGFNTSGTGLLVGYPDYSLALRGSANRPTYNGSNIALQSDISASKGRAYVQEEEPETDLIGTLWYDTDEEDGTSDLLEHINNKENPHSVTAAQVGADAKGSAAQALTAAKAYTDTEKAKYLPLTGGTMTGLLKINMNGNTVTIGSQNKSCCHFYNSDDRPFLFNNSVATLSGNLGLPSHPWGNLYLSGVLSDGTNSITVANIANKNNYLPLSGGTMTGAIYSTTDMQLRPQTGVIRFGDSLTTGSLAVLAGAYDAWYLRPGSDKVFDLGVSGTRWKNLYLSGTLSDGTNSISVANIANKNNYLPLTGGTMTGELIFNGGGSKIVLKTGSGQITNSGAQTLFGFLNSSQIAVGHGSYALAIKGSATRPAYNGKDLALYSDLTTFQGRAYVQEEEPETDLIGALWYDTDEEDGTSDLLEHINDTSNPHAVTAAQVGADAKGSAAQALANAKAYTDTHTNNKENPHGVTAAQVGADAKGSAAQALTDAKAYTDTEKAKYLPLAGGVITGTINAREVSNILDFGASGYFRGETTSGNKFDIFGYSNPTTLYVGSSYPALSLRGKNTRPTYNNADLALYSDLSNYLPLSGGTMTGAIYSTTDMQLRPQTGVIRFGNSITNGSLAVLAGANETWYLRPGSDNVFDLGTIWERWKNLYLSGAITDGTNSIAVSNIANKNNYLPLSGGTMTGSILIQGSNPYLGLVDTSGVAAYFQTHDDGSGLKAGFGYGWANSLKLDSLGNMTLVGNLTDGTNSIAVANIANKNDIAATKYASTSTSAQSIFKISGFGNWGSGTWNQKGFSMLITSRAGETVWLTLSANDSDTMARAIRLMNTYSKILKIHYSVSESAIYVTANAWCNNVSAHIISNLYGDYVPTVATASALASDAVEISITEMGPSGSGSSVTTKLGSASVPINLLGSADRPQYNSANLALYNDLMTFQGRAYVQEEEPETDLIGALWYDTDEEDGTGEILEHINNKKNPHSVTAAQVGADAKGSAAQALTDAKAYTDTHANNKKNPHAVTAAQVGADAKGSAAQALIDAKAYTDSEIEDIQIGGRNLFLNTGLERSNNNYCIATYAPADEPLVAGEIYTISMCVTPATGADTFWVYSSLGYKTLIALRPSGNGKQILTGTFTMRYADGRTPDVNIRYANCDIYRYPDDGTVTENTTIHWLKVEKGNKATDWSPAPEDILAEAKKYTDTEKAKYLPLSGGTMTGLLKINMNGNTITVGSQNSGFCHIYNSADIPFIFNKTVATTSGDLGLSGYPWRNLYLSGVLTDGTNSISVANIANKNNYLPLSGGTLSGTLNFSDSNSWITPYLLAFKNADPNNSPAYPYTGFYQWNNEWQVNARDANNVWQKNIFSINLDTSVAAFLARPTVNGTEVALKSDLTTFQGSAYVQEEEPETGLIGALWYDTDEEDGTGEILEHINNKKNPHSVTAEQVGADAKGSAESVYNLAKLYTDALINNYLPLSGGTLSGALTVSGKITQGSPSSNSTLTEMNRFKNDLFVEGSGAAPNIPQVPGFYLGKSTSDENRHMDIVSGATYSYIDFNKAGSNEDYDVRLLVNVENGDTVFRWGFGEHLTEKNFNVLGTIRQNGSRVALKSDIPDLSGYLPLTGGTLTGSLVAPIYKSDNTESAIKLSDGNEVNFGSNSNLLYIGYENRVGSSGKIDTYKFGTHSGTDGATNGTIECGTIKAKSGIFSGALKVNDGGGYIAGRVYGSGDDEGLIIGRAANGYAGVILGTHDSTRSVFYLRSDNAASWRYVNGGTYELLHPGKSGTIATTADLPSTETWTFTLEDGSTVTKAVCVG